MSLIVKSPFNISKIKNQSPKEFKKFSPQKILKNQVENKDTGIEISPIGQFPKEKDKENENDISNIAKEKLLSQSDEMNEMF